MKRIVFTSILTVSQTKPSFPVFLSFRVVDKWLTIPLIAYMYQCANLMKPIYLFRDLYKVQTEFVCKGVLN